jgi:hypothetical protein
VIRSGILALGLAFAGLASAGERVTVCHGYGCLVQEAVGYSEGQLGEIRRLLFAADDAAGERQRLAEALGRLYAWAGQQSEIRNDKGGNYADEAVSGRMDCIDHSTTTTRLLRVLEARGYLRWHRVVEPMMRSVALIFAPHHSAVIETLGDGEVEAFAVDSWFVDNGQPAVILPLADWKKGAGPDV